MSLPKKLISIVGPTAIGKTSLAIEVANHFNTEIISADSRQFYQEMAIGTAKPSVEERAQAIHHFVDFLPVDKLYSAGDFERAAMLKITEIHEHKDVVVMVGGSGLYVNAVCLGLDDMPADIILRKKLKAELETDGFETLQSRLKELDPVGYEQMDHLNTQRVVRALEVCLTSGKPFSSFHKEQEKQRPFEVITIGLTADRQYIYDRINMRVDMMIETGLVHEVIHLQSKREENALKTVGYREIFEHLDGEINLPEAIEKIKKNTRNFAKRQLTWFKKQPATWFELSHLDTIIPFLESRITQKQDS
ncbi:MAG: tRNA dimethylallyltransferase [Flavobacteriales bacterium]|jgi:tRNA dimethylallyltransferase